MIVLCVDVRVMGQHLGKAPATPSVSQVAIGEPKHYRDGA
jgi:hypothetical protein